MKDKKVVLASLDDTAKYAAQFVRNLNQVEDTAFVVFLKGDLGAGKTTFTKEIGKCLGVKDTIISPTFILEKKYTTKHTFFKTLVHIDAYRFETPKEANVLNLSETLKDPHTIIFIEWPEKLKGAIKPNVTISLKTKKDGTKEIWQN